MSLIALTGATGFVGGTTLRQLLASGHQVRALVRPGKQLPRLNRLTPIPGTLDNPQALNELVSGCDAIIHAAAAISGFGYEDFARTNVEGCRELVRAMQAHAPTARLIHLSSLAAREPQLSAYAASKRAGEEVITASGLRWVIIRPPAVYGPEDPALRPFWRLLSRGWLPRSGPAEARFSLLHVEDLAEATRQLAETTSFSSTICCLHDGASNGYGWPDIAGIAAARLGHRVRIIALPGPLLRTVATVNLLAARISRQRPPVLTPGKLPELAHIDWVCDNTQLPGCPEWKPTMQLKDCLDSLPGWSSHQ
jgi:2-alkyl-3-oxoalkanoate reductase